MTENDLKNRLKNSLKIAELVEDSYKIANNDTININRDSYDLVWPIVGKFSTEVLIATQNSSNTIFIAFPGTQSTFDKFVDASIGQTKNVCGCPFKKIFADDQRIHAGIKFVYCGIRKLVIEKIEIFREKTNGKVIDLSGHSLGGGIATLLALEFTKKYNDCTINLTTFGNPAIGNNYFKSLADSLNSLRVVNKDDPIPYLLEDFDEFHHIDNFIELAENGLVSLTKTTEIDTSFKAGMVFLDSVFKKVTPQPHKMVEYIRRMKLIQ